MKTALLAVLWVGLTVGSVQAAEFQAGLSDEAYFTIQGVRLEEIPDPSPGALDGDLRDMGVLPPEAPLSSTALPPIDIAEIVNMAQSIWKVIKDNKPVVNLRTDRADALPKGIDSWTRLGYWKTPVSKVYRITYENLYGMDVVSFSFRVLFNYGGRYNGKGRYIANATIVPAKLDVAWGYTFNAQATVAAILNAGSPRNPVAAIQLDLQWSVDTVLKHMQRTENFYLVADGSIRQLD